MTCSNSAIRQIFDMPFGRIQIDLMTFLLTAVLCAVFVYSLQFLPTRYYFQFSYISADKDRSGSMLTDPTLPIAKDLCDDVLVEGRKEYRNYRRLVNLCRERRALINDRILVPFGVTVDGNRLFTLKYQSMIESITSLLHQQSAELRVPLADTPPEEIADRRKLSDRLEALTEEEVHQGLLESFERDARMGNADHADVEAERSFLLAFLFESIEDTDGKRSTLLRSIIAANAKLDATLGQYYDIVDSGEHQHRTYGQLEERYFQGLVQANVVAISNQLLAVDDYSFVIAIFLKILPAFFAGLIVAYVTPEHARVSAPAATAFVAFLYCWPVVLLWDQVVQSSWSEMRNYFFALYAAYCMAYLGAAWLGCSLAPAMRSATKRRPVLNPKIDWTHVTTSFVTTAVASLATALMTWGITRVAQ